MLKVKVIWGSLREGTFGENPAKFAFEIAKQEPGWEVEYINLQEINLPFSMGSPTPSQANGTYTDPIVQAWSDKIKDGDAYIVVTSEYNHGYSSVLKNALDHLFPEWHHKPVAFVGYGGQLGGGRAVEQLRQVVAELKMVSIREAIYLSYVWQAFDEFGRPQDTELASKLKNMFEELTWWGNALKTAREKSV